MTILAQIWSICIKGIFDKELRQRENKYTNNINISKL